MNILIVRTQNGPIQGRYEQSGAKRDKGAKINIWAKFCQPMH